MFMDYITYQGVMQDVAEQMMLQDLERHFRKSHSSLRKYGFPVPDGGRLLQKKRGRIKRLDVELNQSLDEA